jgi:queuine tRNA-ribosyltransferase
MKTCGTARAGELLTAHGTVPTPVFMPVGSQATVKALTPEDVTALGFRMVLANTYHLYLRPGIDIIRKMGGLHNFMAWDGALFTDSGGYQLFSLAALCRINDDGVTFRSHIDGSEHFITPELAVQYQEALGADVMMVLDECTAYGDSPQKVQTAMARTHRWAQKCLHAHKGQGQSLYAIVQGGFSPQWRRESAGFLTTLDFPGYAIGGLSVGEPKETTLEMVALTAPLLPEDKPRYLMGVGSPEDIVENVARGIDIFDSALPTRVARNGALFTARGRRNIRNAAFSRREDPIDADCDCYTCKKFSAAYLSHLFKSEELLAYRLATIHNLRFISNLMGRIRQAIMEGTFDAFHKDFLASYKPADAPTRFEQKQRWLRGRMSHDSDDGKGDGLTLKSGQ